MAEDVDGGRETRHLLAEEARALDVGEAVAEGARVGAVELGVRQKWEKETQLHQLVQLAACAIASSLHLAKKRASFDETEEPPMQLGHRQPPSIIDSGWPRGMSTTVPRVKPVWYQL